MRLLFFYCSTFLQKKCYRQFNHTAKVYRRASTLAGESPAFKAHRKFISNNPYRIDENRDRVIFCKARMS